MCAFFLFWTTSIDGADSPLLNFKNKGARASHTKLGLKKLKIFKDHKAGVACHALFNSLNRICKIKNKMQKFSKSRRKISKFCLFFVYFIFLNHMI